jgi:hypothetical protein
MSDQRGRGPAPGSQTMARPALDERLAGTEYVLTVGLEIDDEGTVEDDRDVLRLDLPPRRFRAVGFGGSSTIS